MITKRNIAMIAFFLDLDRRELLPALRGLSLAKRNKVMAALLIEATRW